MKIVFVVFGILALAGGTYVVSEAPAVTQEMAGLLIILIGTVCLGFAAVIESIQRVGIGLKGEDEQEDEQPQSAPMSQRDRILWVVIAVIVLGVVVFVLAGI